MDEEARRELELSRRRLFQLGAGAAAGLLLPQVADLALAEGAEGDEATRMAASLANAVARYEPWREPPEWTPRDGALTQTLRVTQQAVMIQEADGTVRTEITRTYNGQVPGPTLRVRPGERLDLTVINDLPPNDDPHCSEHHQNKPSCFNTTNLHTHGLHVSPSTRPDGIASDDVFINIPPRPESTPENPYFRRYCIWLPQFHAPGTHWYHAHRHGSTALQVVNGLVGALIVEEPPDQYVPVDGENLWIVGEIIGNQNSEASKVYTCRPPTPSFTVNGLSQPTLIMRPNEIRRWRFVNATATPRGFMNLFLQNVATGAKVPMHLMALDGILFYGKRPQANTGQTLSPGNRADFLVKLPAGHYQVVKGASLGPGGDQVLADVLVTGTPLPDRPLPSLPGIAVRPFYLTPIRQVTPGTPTRPYVFAVDGGNCRNNPGGPIDANFTINGKKYGEPGTLTQVRLNTAEEWHLTNTSGAAHPFHIHVNPFQVVEEGKDPEEWTWWDTIYIPAAANGVTGERRIRHRFLTYNGKFVIHCHVLVHEDLGMMQDVEVVGGGVPPCTPLAPAGEY
jgi:FtsP/CotA-like multicopper oxidase with cupredoxin domain